MTDLDVDKLPPTQQLVLDVLAARYRLGEPFWPVTNWAAPAVAALKRVGLVENMGSAGHGGTRVQLTAAGRERLLHADYRSPVEIARTRAIYAEKRRGELNLAVTQAWAELVRREREHAGHGRDGHLDEEDLNLLRDVVFGTEER